MLRHTSSVALAVLLSLSCSREESKQMDRAETHGRLTDPASNSSAQAAASAAVVPSADQHGTRLEGPRDENAGRNFEGRLQLQISGLSHPLKIRYTSRGERGRLQVEREGSGATGSDVIFGGDEAIVLKHAVRKYAVRDMNDVKPRTEPKVDVTVEQTSDRTMLAGLACYRWRLKAGPQTVETCVRGLPGAIDSDKLETLLDIDVPAWVEKLIEDNYLPVSATVSENGRELYRLELLQYSPDAVPENELSVPANYQKI